MATGAEGIGDGNVLLERKFPLLRVIEGVREDEGKIVARVEERRAALAEQTGLRGRELADALARQLVDEHALRSAAIGAGAALPWSFPLLGPVGTTLFTVLGGAMLQLANEVELCYAIGATYRTRLSSERLRLVAFWLVRLTNFDELRAKALTMGVRLTTRKLVEKLIAIGLTRAFAATAMPAMMQGMGIAATQTAPWYVRAVPYLGVPALGYLGWRSTQGVGERAIAYFSEADP
jgi:hypothetical protein